MRRVLPALLLLLPLTALADTVPAKDTEAIKKLVGKEATVAGTVDAVSTTRTGAITFINFKGNQRSDFTGIIKKDAKAAVDKAFDGDVAKALKGKAVELSGTVSDYRGTPQIEVTKPEQIKIVPDANGDAPKSDAKDAPKGDDKKDAK